MYTCISEKFSAPTVGIKKSITEEFKWSLLSTHKGKKSHTRASRGGIISKDGTDRKRNSTPDKKIYRHRKRARRAERVNNARSRSNKNLLHNTSGEREGKRKHVKKRERERYEKAVKAWKMSSCHVPIVAHRHNSWQRAVELCPILSIPPSLFPPSRRLLSLAKSSRSVCPRFPPRPRPRSSPSNRLIGVLISVFETGVHLPFHSSSSPFPSAFSRLTVRL